MPHPTRHPVRPSCARAVPAARGAPPLRAGMTLVELMVALLVSTIMAILAYQLFDTTRLSARAGISRSTVIQEVYVAETRLRMDFASMLGPLRTADSPGGAILVIPGLRNGLMPKPGNPAGVPVTKLRSDQIVFFYDAKHGGLIRDSGTGLEQKSLTRTGVKSTQTKIWMGHVQRANGESDFAPDWTVGRSSTLLIDPDSTVVNTPVALETTAALPPTDPRAPLSPLNPVSQTSDVAGFGLEEISNWMRAPGRTNAQMVAAFAVTPNDSQNYTNLPVVVTQPLSDGVFDAGDLFSSHRIFLSHRSEFIVQYSADQDADGLVDTTGATPYAGTIKWFPQDADIYNFASPNHAAAMKPVVFYPQDDQVRVIHLGYYQGADTAKYRLNSRGHRTPYPRVGSSEFGDALPSLAAYNAAMAAYGAHHNGWQPSAAFPPAQSQWPQLIRIRYRLHDPRGEIYSFNEEFPFNQRDDDGDGVVDNASEARCCGIWVEHIFAIPYPRTN